MNATASSTPSSDEPAELLRARVVSHLEAQGYAVRNGRLITQVERSKSRLRELHGDAVAEQRRRAQPALSALEEVLIANLADGREVRVGDINAELVLVEDKNSLDAKLWRWSALHWSVPVSAGYGRRLRFLVRDRAHGNALVGIIGLGDPVYSLRARDAWIGWTPEQKREGLPKVLDAYALGAVPPYSGILGGKLVALLATSREVQEAFSNKYAARTSLIRERVSSDVIALISTASALGRSSIYNRLSRPDGTLAFRSVGYTSGTGDFHFSGAIYDELVEFARERHSGSTSRHEQWGTGFRNRREVVQRALYAMGFDGYAMRAHGVRRELYVAPIMSNSREVLRGDLAAHCEPSAVWTQRDVNEWWRKRWAEARAIRVPEWRSFDTQSWRLWQSDSS